MPSSFDLIVDSGYFTFQYITMCLFAVITTLFVTVCTGVDIGFLRTNAAPCHNSILIGIWKFTCKRIQGRCDQIKFRYSEKATQFETLHLDIIASWLGSRMQRTESQGRCVQLTWSKICSGSHQKKKDYFAWNETNASLNSFLQLQGRQTLLIFPLVLTLMSFDEFFDARTAVYVTKND